MGVYISNNSKTGMSAQRSNIMPSMLGGKLNSSFSPRVCVHLKIDDTRFVTLRGSLRMNVVQPLCRSFGHGLTERVFEVPS